MDNRRLDGVIVGGFDPGNEDQQAQIVAEVLVRAAREKLQRIEAPPPEVLSRDIPDPEAPDTARMPWWGIVPIATSPASIFLWSFLGDRTFYLFALWLFVGAIVLVAAIWSVTKKNRVLKAQYSEALAQQALDIQQEHERVLTAKSEAKPDIKFLLTRRPKRIWIGYLPVAQRRFAGGTVLLDLSGVLDHRGLRLRLLPQRDRIETLIDRIRRLQPPTLLARRVGRSITGLTDSEGHKRDLDLYGEEGDLSQYLANLTEVLNDQRVVKFDSPFLHHNDGLGAWVPGDPTSAAPRHLPIVTTTTDPLGILTRFKDEVSSTSSEAIRAGSLSAESKKYLAGLQETTEKKEREFRTEQDHALRRILPNLIETTVNVFAYGSYNFYCPQCNAEALTRYASSGESKNEFDQNSRLRYQIESDHFDCPLCDYDWYPSNDSCDQPLTVHRMKDEIIYPAWDRLILERAEERRTLVRESEDRCQNFHNDMSNFLQQTQTDHKAQEDALLREMRALEATLVRDQQVVTSLKDMLVKYDKMSSERGDTYARECEEAAERIRRQVGEAVARLKERDNALIERAVEEMDAIARSKTTLDKLRHEELIAYQETHVRGRTAQLAATQEGTEAARRMAEAADRNVEATNQMAETVGNKLDATTESVGNKLDSVSSGINTTNAILRANTSEDKFKRRTLGLRQSEVAESREKNLNDGLSAGGGK